MTNLHPMFAEILKPHLESQTVVKRDLVRFDGLRKGWGYLTRELGESAPSFGTFIEAVEIYERTRDEAHLDAQYERERSLDKRQAANDEAWEQEVIERRSRDAQRARS